LSAHWPS
jgi:hypothetical protein